MERLPRYLGESADQMFPTFFPPVNSAFFGRFHRYKGHGSFRQCGDGQSRVYPQVCRDHGPVNHQHVLVILDKVFVIDHPFLRIFVRTTATPRFWMDTW